MTAFDIRQEKPYRRGLILGLTVAEIMILLIFVLLMALSAALASRDKKIKEFEPIASSELIEKIKFSYPKSHSQEEYFKELVRAIDSDVAWGDGNRIIDEAMIADAALGKSLRLAAEKSSSSKPLDLMDKDLLDNASIGKKLREAAKKNGDIDPEIVFDKNLLANAALGQTMREEAAQSPIRNPEAYLKWLVAAAEDNSKTTTPPFLNLSEAGGYYFDTGKATLRPQVEEKITTEIIPILRALVDQYNVDVVEVVGHTDEVPMVGATNLDKRLIDAAKANFSIEKLTSSDNAGLAMARAVSVVSLLKSSEALKDLNILPLSGAQMILPDDMLADGSLSKSDEARRRIEIRLRRKSGQVAGV